MALFIFLTIWLVAYSFLYAGAPIQNLVANPSLLVSAFLPSVIMGLIIPSIGEEPGWRGFALPRLQTQFGPVLGTLILGVLWAGWHLPGYLGGWMQAQPLALLVSSVAFSIVMTWVYNNTRGSLLLMIVLHASSNAALSVGTRVLPANLPAGLNTFVYGGWIPALTYTLLAGMALAATRGTLAYDKGKQPPAQLDTQPLSLA